MDNIVLNFSTDEPAKSTNKVHKKGGRWTERVKANRITQQRKDHSTTAPKRRIEEQTQTYERPLKKARTEMSAPSASKTQSSAARPIISSLFTYNPRIDALPDTSSSSIPQKPSNAPVDDASAFSGLGLDSLLISHLSTKMNVTNPTSIQKAALPVILSEKTKERDVFIQSQTGSGKTLAFLLPIIQDLLPLSELSWIDRTIGTLAIIIAPTRELAQQISSVLETLLQLRLRPKSDDGTESSARLTRWLVSGLLTGGATRNHEKNRLRKGCPILVSTPGRLLDHLQNTSSFNCTKCRWLVLDEADRLMELGFEETIDGIIKGLDGRRGMAIQSVEKTGGLGEVGGWDWKRGRRTILCSATIREDVQKLAGRALSSPVVVKAIETTIDQDKLVATTEEKFTPPSQLTQRYIVIPLKLRLVSLVALLRNIVTQSRGRPGRGTKIIVFLSCTDSVDFHWKILSGVSMDDREEEEGDDKEEDSKDTKSAGMSYEATSEILPKTLLYRLHGSLPQQTRMASLKAFSSSKPSTTADSDSAILFCTSVASRGLDLPMVRAVVQYDLPTEGGATEYIHRVGRTARAGKGGEAWAVVAPSETEWVPWVEKQMSSKDEGSAEVKLHGSGVDGILKKGFGGNGKEYEARATEVQLSFERWVLENKEHADLARKAFLSHMRAYSTHPSNEKHLFHVRNLHIGHLAKAFALRDAPTQVATKKNHAKVEKVSKGNRQGQKDWDEGHDGEAERRMQAVVRAQGRLTKKGGVMMSSGASEFQTLGGNDLEKLVQGAR